MKSPAILGSIAALSLGLSASADLYRFSAELLPTNEDPPVEDSEGVGFAFVTYDDVARMLRVQLSFKNLEGATTVAHIHAPTAVPFAGNVGVATFPGTFPDFPAGVHEGEYEGMWSLADLGSYTGGFLTATGSTTSEEAEAALLDALLEGRAYVNIHSTHRTSGEIRGFLRQVPDGGSTGLLLGLGFLATVGCARGRR
jgi:hypothetical protein